ncbi:MAG: sulfotransferase domain-containing protein [Candidatus Paceibacterota bacterium]
MVLSSINPELFSEGCFAWRKTPTYSYLPEIPELIYNFNPQVKLIWIFREPVSRTFSNYMHAYKKGVEKRTFSQAVQDELDGKEKNIWKKYIKRSIYIEQVNNYLMYFKLEQMYFCLFEDLIEDEVVELKKIANFLNIDPEMFINIDKASKNTTKVPVSPYLRKVTREYLSNGNILARIVNKINLTLGSYQKHKIDNISKEYLMQYFTSYNNELEQTIGINLKKIWK